jgi:hypothetical protein
MKYFFLSASTLFSSHGREVVNSDTKKNRFVAQLRSGTPALDTTLNSTTDKITDQKKPREKGKGKKERGGGK